jgi:hypothetical protein
MAPRARVVGRFGRASAAVLCLAVATFGAVTSAQQRDPDSRGEDRPAPKDESFEGGDEAANRGQVGPNTVVEGFDLNGEALRRFTGPAWSLVFPDRDYQGGCVVGFLAFKFSPTGYFIYNNRLKGTWRVDELGNLLMRTRDGLRFTLIVEGNTLHPTENLPFARRFYQFQRCPA